MEGGLELSNVLFFLITIYLSAGPWYSTVLVHMRGMVSIYSANDLSPTIPRRT